MKKNVIKYGLLAGLIVSVWMLGSIAYCYSTGKFEGSMILGFASMIIAFAVMYPAIKNYRDKQNGGVISFGSAFKMALLIAFIGSTIYVAVWLVDYYLFIPDFMERYSAHIIEKAQNSGASATEIAAKVKEINSMKGWYDSFIGVVLMTYMEIFPIGVVVSLITALILKRKANNGSVAVA
ncbi:DUF4199 domain-containing protein [Mucilaginibacter terrigena]|uniref:DUF4199 domain-containing protein n=1 Tax=Mucilaginibacter terrigena TaxID=2492395 RepID=A0A4Q5LRI1_9SPHI|nr:DUF4199 domain-containing protein [Mucilaginibacter terrigena]RYU92111.1 DUF4199 domain-containing protein [Mucilaginibacter terrigena]